MIEKNLDLIYNKKYLVIVPSIDEYLLEGFDYSFKNVILMKNTIDDVNFMVKYINKNNFRKIIFVDYIGEYESVLKNIKAHDYSFIFTKSLATFSNIGNYEIYKKVYNLYKSYEGAKLGILDYSLYSCLKNNNENIEYIMLDIKNLKYSSIKQNTIGILNSQDNPNHSYYNELSAVKLVDDSRVNLENINKVTKNFLKTFAINYIEYKNIEEVLINSEINLYINFTDNNNLLFLKSMDNDIPCILGNNEILDSANFLKSMLIMESDDDIDEIANRITLVKNNKDKILEEYKKFRKKYSEQSKKSIELFLNNKMELKESIKKYDKLISVVVPVYNVEDYLAKSLDSIISAKVNDMEIIIINDGSTDNSEKIILDYVKKYPDLIRYIKQTNHGLGNVRNVGLKEVRGKYIASIDSDDTINKNFFNDALKYLKKDIDIVIYDWMTVTDDSKNPTAALDYIFDNNDWNKYEGILYTTIMPSACNKIVKKELFDKLNIKYIEDKYEDLSTTPFIMLEAENIAYIDKPYYEYYIRNNSIMRTKPGYSMIDILKKFDERLEKYKYLINVDIDDFKFYTYSWRIEEYIINPLYEIDESEISSFVEYIYANIKNLVLEIFNNEKYVEVLNKLNSNEKEYIQNRNNAILNETLESFIKSSRKKEIYFKLTPPIIFYGI